MVKGMYKVMKNKNSFFFIFSYDTGQEMVQGMDKGLVQKKGQKMVYGMDQRMVQGMGKRMDYGIDKGLVQGMDKGIV